jgi:hypothetical protein
MVAHFELGFLDRLAYLRWLRNRGRTKPETDAELASAWGVGEKWLSKWKLRTDAPEGRSESAAIAKAIGAGAMSWLYDGVGEAPEPETWAAWYAEWLAAQRAPRLKLRPAKEPASAAKKRA